MAPGRRDSLLRILGDRRVTERSRNTIGTGINAARPVVEQEGICLGQDGNLEPRSGDLSVALLRGCAPRSNTRESTTTT